MFCVKLRSLHLDENHVMSIDFSCQQFRRNVSMIRNTQWFVIGWCQGTSWQLKLSPPKEIVIGQFLRKCDLQIKRHGKLLSDCDLGEPPMSSFVDHEIYKSLLRTFFYFDTYRFQQLVHGYQFLCSTHSLLIYHEVEVCFLTWVLTFEIQSIFLCDDVWRCWPARLENTRVNLVASRSTYVFLSISCCFIQSSPNCNFYIVAFNLPNPLIRKILFVKRRSVGCDIASNKNSFSTERNLLLMMTFRISFGRQINVEWLSVSRWRS